jgi:hypothetical protein
LLILSQVEEILMRRGAAKDLGLHSLGQDTTIENNGGAIKGSSAVGRL